MERRLDAGAQQGHRRADPVPVPPDDLLPERLAGVLRVVYLVFNEGHAATRGEPRATGGRSGSRGCSCG